MSEQNIVERYIETRAADTRKRRVTLAAAELSEATGRRYSTGRLYEWRLGRRPLPSIAREVMLRAVLRDMGRQDLVSVLREPSANVKSEMEET